MKTIAQTFISLLAIVIACVALHDSSATRSPAPAGPKMGGSFGSGAWTVPHWYVDGSNVSTHASDGNDCQTASTPCLTYAQIVTRWGTTSPVLVQATTITWLSDGQATDTVACNPSLRAPNGAIMLIGTPTMIGSGTFTSVTPKNRATGQLLNTDLGTSPTTFVGEQIFDVTRSGWAWVDAVVSGNVVALTQPFVAAYTAPSTFVTTPGEVDSFASGDTFQVWRPSTVSLVEVRPASDAQRADNCPAYVANIHVPDPTAVATHLVRFDSSVYATGMSSDRILVQSAASMTAEPYSYVNCWLNAGANGATESSEATTIVGGAVDTSQLYATNGPFVFDGDVLLHGFVALQPPITDVCGAYVDNFVLGAGIVRLFPNAYATGDLWGPGMLYLYIGATMNMAQNAATSLLITGGLSFNGASTASAYDTSSDPAVWHPGRTLSPANLDLSIASGGFGGNAVDPAQGIALSAP